VSAYTAALFAAASLSTAVVNRGLDHWQDAHLSWGWVLVVMLGGVPVAALAGWLQPPDAAGERPAPAEALPLTATERVTWSGRSEAGPVLWVPAMVLVGLGLPSLVGGVGPADRWVAASLLL